MAFTKLFASIIHSSIWREPDHVRLVWVTMLAMADAQGYVGASLPGLADAARVSLEQCQDALARFHAPDPYSRSMEHEGRRVATVERGWRLLNYERFRAVASAEAERERKRLWWQENRSSEALASASDTRHKQKQKQKQSAEAEAEAKATTPPPPPPPGGRARKRRPVVYTADFEARFWTHWRWRGSKALAAIEWEALSEADRAAVVTDLVGRRRGDCDPRWIEEDGKYILGAERYLKRRLWEEKWAPAVKPHDPEDDVCKACGYLVCRCNWRKS